MHERPHERPDRASPPTQNTRDEQVLPVVEETLSVDKRRVETGRVRVHKRVDESERTVDEPLHRERVEIERVPVGRVVEHAPPIREEDGVTIVPVVEEELVVEKRLVLKEEVRIRRVEEEFRDPHTFRVRRESVDVERDEGGEKTKPGDETPGGPSMT